MNHCMHCADYAKHCYRDELNNEADRASFWRMWVRYINASAHNA